ncbi:hypothetical protein GPL15_22065 [Clostridium sp. MCC353]|uniref:hypothetical protein n=1 Tax=Clostridium sp. MCC353 TaxID=2592646 RepID=UPI001C01DA95|nr:hypothetical protein [Clostridium sp. MCC353]MBT9779168.1 hypothetical protein [Clostridium sp. MCC353]
MDQVIELLYKISNELHSLVNGAGIWGNSFYSFGKIYSNWEEIPKNAEGVPEKQNEEKGDYIRDFRMPEVDGYLAECAKARMVTLLNDFCKENKSNDEVAMAVGCTLNLYYNCGLFDRLGIFNVNQIQLSWEDETLGRYVQVEEKMILACLLSYFSSLKIVLNDEILNKYSETGKKEYLDTVVSEIDEKWDVVKPFVKQIIVYLKNAADEDLNTAVSFLDELLQIEPKYQFANMYKCIIAVRSYLDTEGEDTSVDAYEAVLDKELVNIAYGIERPSTFKGEVKDGEFRTIHPELFSEFGLGIPYIKFISKQSFLAELGTEKIFSNFTELREDISRALFLPHYLPADGMDQVMSIMLSERSRLKRSEAEREKAIAERKKVVNQFSHTYMGMRATSLYNVATSLLKKDDTELKNYGRKILYEYSVKKNLTKDIEMLKLRFEDRKSELQDKIRASICPDGLDGVGVDKLMHDAMTRCMVTLVHDGGPGAKRIREKFTDYDLIGIRNSFEENILFSENGDIISWFNKNLFPLTVRVSERWNSLAFEDESYAALLITGVLTELIINIFKYADKEKGASVEFTEDDGCFLITAQNHIDKNSAKSKEGGFGLEAEADAIEIINEAGGLKGDAIVTESDEDLFTTKIRLGNALFE